MGGVSITEEICWRREVVTSELAWLGDEMCRRTGQPATAAGDKGNTAHLRGSHRSQDWILHSVYCTNRTYTVQSGLAAEQLLHIAGFDFAPGEWGTARNRELMIEQTGRLLAAMQAGLLDEVRELYGTVDGRTVTGWNNAENRVATSDDSHLDHWHLGFDRRHMTNRALMERIVSIALGDDMTPAEHNTLVATDARVRALINNTPSAIYQIPGEKAPRSEPNKMYDALGAIAGQLTALQARPPVEPAPVDPAVLKAALLDPDFLKAVAKAVADEDHARSEN